MEVLLTDSELMFCCQEDGECRLKAMTSATEGKDKTFGLASIHSSALRFKLKLVYKGGNDLGKQAHTAAACICD